MDQLTTTRALMPVSESFITWLDDQPDGSIVGYAGHRTDSPVARYAAARGVEDPMVALDWIVSLKSEEKVMRVPKWANDVLVFLLADDFLGRLEENAGVRKEYLKSIVKGGAT